MSGQAVDLALIEAAAATLAGQLEPTPLRHSRTLSEITGAELWLKFETRHYTASFKERGASEQAQQPERGRAGAAA